MGEIRFVGTGETRGYPYLVCKKRKYIQPYRNRNLLRENGIMNIGPAEIKRRIVKDWLVGWLFWV